MRSLSALVFAAALAAAGCFGTSPSHLAKGEAYSSGSEKYDTFFVSVSELSTRAQGASGESDLRKQVAEAVGLSSTAKLEDTIDAAKARSNDYKKDGGKFFVVVAAEPKLIMKKGSEESKEAAAFAKAIEDAIKGRHQAGRRARRPRAGGREPGGDARVPRERGRHGHRGRVHARPSEDRALRGEGDARKVAASSRQ
jgi:hypothetical protein